VPERPPDPEDQQGRDEETARHRCPKTLLPKKRGPREPLRQKMALELCEQISEPRRVRRIHAV
jgi:hypothetical protein